MPNSITSITKSRLFFYLTLIITGLIILATSLVYYYRLGIFGCFDQCFNFVAGYFMLKNRQLYSEIFFNHQPLGAWLSYLLQLITQPQTLYSLILYHRLFVIIFSLLMDLLIIWRLRWPGLGFVLFYETSKYYLMGHLFLPEAFIPYLLVFLLGLLWHRWQKKLSLFDQFLIGLFTYAIIFLRETFSPLAVVLFLFLKPTKIAWLTLTLLSLVSLATLPFNDYLFNLTTVNLNMATSEVQRFAGDITGLIKPVIYPFLVFFPSKTTPFWTVLASINLLFLTNIAFFIFKTKKIKLVLLFFLILALANLRPVTPGTLFYESFHLLSWYAVLLIFTFLTLPASPKPLFLFPLFLLVYSLLPQHSFLWERVDRMTEFTVNYAQPYSYGSVIKILSQTNDTVFLDLWDDLIYWQTGLDSSFSYAFYTPVASSFEKFTRQRLNMFTTHAPTFYYSYPGSGPDCPPLFPPKLKSDYQQLLINNQPSCLYVQKTKLSQITDSQWQKIKNFGFQLP